MKSKFLLLIAISIIFITIGIPQTFANSDTETKTSYQTVETNTNQKEEDKYFRVGEKVEVTADVTNMQDRSQPFAYIVQIKNEYGVAVSLAWLTGELNPNQSLSPALAWFPEDAGIYTATVFVWEGIDRPIAISHPLDILIEVKDGQPITPNGRS